MNRMQFIVSAACATAGCAALAAAGLATAAAVELKDGAEFAMRDAPKELTAHVKRGGSVRFLLEENGTTGYQWEATYASNECSVAIEHRGADTSAGLCGAPGKAAFTVTKKAAVQTPAVVEFAYRRSWEKGEPAQRVRLILHTVPDETAGARSSGDLAPAVVAPGGLCVKSGEKLAFLGDSITAYGNGPAGYVNLVMMGLAEMGVRPEKIPAGVSGNKSNDMLARLDRDVLSRKPQWMTLSCGVNDVWHGKNGVPLESYKKNIAAILDRCAASNVNVIVFTATMITEDASVADNRKLKPYNDFLRDEAKRRGLRVADMDRAMHAELERRRASGERGRNLLTTDGVHMNFEGNKMLARNALLALGAPEIPPAVEARWRNVPHRELRFVVSDDDWAAIEARAKAAGRCPADYLNELVPGRKRYPDSPDRYVVEMRPRKE